MTTTMSQELLGRFDKSVAQKYLGVLKDEGIQLIVEDIERTAIKPRIKVYVAQNEYARAVELIKNFALRLMIQAERDKKEFERKIMNAFFIFTGIFILYIIATHV